MRFKIGDVVSLKKNKIFSDGVKIPKGVPGLIEKVHPDTFEFTIAFDRFAKARKLPGEDLDIDASRAALFKKLRSNAYHFAPYDTIPVLDRRGTISMMLELLGGQKKGGFVLKDEVYDYYVKGRLLIARSELFRQENGRYVEEEKWDKVKVVNELRSVPEAFLRIRIPNSKDTQIDLQKREDSVFAIGYNGLFLNHETVKETLTERPVFKCTNPRKQHYNFSKTPNKCRSCPYKLEI